MTPNGTKNSDDTEAFNKNISAGTLMRGNEAGIQAHEKAVRIMAGEPRVARRMLGGALMDVIHATASDGDSTRLMLTQQRPDVGYVFILHPRRAGEEYGEYRERRTKKLMAYCHVSKHVYPQLTHIVGVATEPHGNQGSSEELVYVDATNWNEHDEARARELHEKGLLKNARLSYGTTHEFPEIREDKDAARRARNQRKRERRSRARRKRR